MVEIFPYTPVFVTCLMSSAYVYVCLFVHSIKGSPVLSSNVSSHPLCVMTVHFSWCHHPQRGGSLLL